MVRSAAVAFWLVAVPGVAFSSSSVELTLAGTFDFPTGVFSVALAENRACLAAADSGLLIVDVTHPDSARLLGRFDSNCVDVAVSGDMACMLTGAGRLILVDISNPALPGFIGQSNTLGAHEVAVWNDHAYLLHHDAGLLTVDISDPSSPWIEDTCAGWLPADLEYLYLRLSDHLAVVPANEVLSPHPHYLYFFDLSDPGSPCIVGEIEVSEPSDFADIGLAGRTMVWCESFALHRLVDVSTPSSPSTVATFSTNGFGWKVTATSDMAYLATRDSVLEAIDISNPAIPVACASYRLRHATARMTADENLVYIADTGGLTILELTGATGLHDRPPTLPRIFRLDQNHPNPFNAGTRIAFELAEPGFVSLDVFDLLGRPVFRLHHGLLPAGEHSFHWNGQGQDGELLASGVYFYRLTVGRQAETRKMLLLR